MLQFQNIFISETDWSDFRKLVVAFVTTHFARLDVKFTTVETLKTYIKPTLL